MRDHLALFLTLAIASACGGGDGAATEGPAAIITAPANGDTVRGTAVTVQLGARGITIRPAGTNEANTGHHHLFIDRDPTPVGEAIPVEPGIVHLGAAQTEYALEGLAPGEHRVIALIGDFAHVRIGTVATDTVHFTVASP